MWVEFVVGSLLAPRVLLRILQFSSHHKNQHFQIPIQPGRQEFTHEPLHYDVKFDLPFDHLESLRIKTYYMNTQFIYQKKLEPLSSKSRCREVIVIG